MNILIIEDDLMTRKVLGHHLLELGHTVATFGSGQEALEALEGNPAVDVIIVDVLMPGISGPSLLLRLKKHLRTRQPKVIVISALHKGEEFMQSLGSQFDHFLPKPIDFNYLDNLLSDFALSAKAG